MYVLLRELSGTGVVIGIVLGIIVTTMCVLLFRRWHNR